MRRILNRLANLELPGSTEAHLRIFFGAVVLFLASLALPSIFSYQASQRANVAASRAEVSAAQREQTAKQSQALLNTLNAQTHQLTVEQQQLQILVNQSLTDQNRVRAGNAELTQIVSDMDRTLNAICMAIGCNAPPITPPNFSSPPTTAPK